MSQHGASFQRWDGTMPASQTYMSYSTRVRLAAMLLLSVSVGLIAGACADQESETDSADLTKDAGTSELALVVSVDWEGRDLREENIAAMEAFRKRFPRIPITQFLNAAYFTKPNAKDGDTSSRIRRTIRPGDELGLHIHGWKRLFEASGVSFRSSPTFWGPDHPLSNDCNDDCGHEVPLSAYSTPELRKVVRFSVDKLKSQGLGDAKSFRTGGWMGKSNVLEALRAEGILRDNSAVATDFLKSEIGTLPLYTWLKETWPTANSTSQAYVIKTAKGDILEIPDNGALADYMRDDEMLGVYQACRDQKKKLPHRPVTINIGFHQETAARFLPVLTSAIDKILARAKADGFTIVPTTTANIKP